MKRLSFFVVLLIIVAVAVLVAVAVDGNEAGAFSADGGFNAGCSACHASTGTWLLRLTASPPIQVFTCTNCHTPRAAVRAP